MKPGPKPKPAQSAVPSGRPITSTPPRFLSESAKKEWRRIVKELGARVTALDQAVLSGYCAAVGRWQDAEALLSETGLFVTTPNGYQVQHPGVAISTRALSAMHRLARELGLTPASRGKLPALPEDDPDDDFFGGT